MSNNDEHRADMPKDPKDRQAENDADIQQRVDLLFQQIAELNTVQALDYLATVEESPQVLQRVMKLIGADESKEYLGSRVDLAGVFSAQTGQSDLSGTEIEGLRLLKKLGAGGMGDVYLAEDTRLQREVAVKCIQGRHRLDSRAKERLRREAIILSRLDHVGICRIYNLIEDENADYLILELIDGVTLGAWLSEVAVSYRRKLVLATSLVDAISAAHLEDIIHRDLKPDNIMVLPGDQVKVLDFGISRVLDSERLGSATELAGVSADTMPGAMLGTLNFMSPEQANGKEVGPPSDIFSLGVVLQQMFSKQAAHPENMEPEQTLQRAHRGETLSVKGLPRDLSQIIESMKSAAPAARPTALEVLASLKKIQQKPVRRVRLALFAGLLLVAALGVFKYTQDLRFEREQAEVARLESEQVSDFLVSLFEVSNPGQSKGEDITARQLLADGAARIDSDLREQPRVLAKLKGTIASVYSNLGLYDEAAVQFQQALALLEPLQITDPGLEVEVLLDFSEMEINRAEYGDAEGLLTAALLAVQSQSKAQHPLQPKVWSYLAVLYSKTDRREEGLKLYQKSLNAYLQEPNRYAREIVEEYNNIGMLHWREERMEAAETNLRTALNRYQRAGFDDLSLKASLLSNLSLILSQNNAIEESAELAESSMKIRQKILGKDHPDMALAYDNLAVAMYRADRIEDAAKWNLLSLEIYEAQLGRQNMHFIYALANRGVVLREQGDMEGAESVLVECIQTSTKLIGNSGSDTLHYQIRLGELYLHQSRLDEAFAITSQARSNVVESQLELRPGLAKAWFQSAEIQVQMGNTDTAVSILQDLISRLEADDSYDPDTINRARVAMADYENPA